MDSKERERRDVRAKKAAKTLTTHEKTLAVYLYGSQARGDATQSSDIDLLVETDEDPINMHNLHIYTWVLEELKSILCSNDHSVGHSRGSIHPCPYSYQDFSKITPEFPNKETIRKERRLLWKK